MRRIIPPEYMITLRWNTLTVTSSERHITGTYLRYAPPYSSRSRVNVTESTAVLDLGKMDGFTKEPSQKQMLLLHYMKILTDHWRHLGNEYKYRSQIGWNPRGCLPNAPPPRWDSGALPESEPGRLQGHFGSTVLSAQQDIFSPRCFVVVDECSSQP